MRLLTIAHFLNQSVRHICARTDFTWRYIANLRATLQYHNLRRPLSPTFQNLLRDLRRDGIAKTSVKEFVTDAALFQELDRAVWELEETMAGEIAQLRTKIHTTGRPKNYLFNLLGSFPSLNPDDVFVRFALQPNLVAFANNYFGMLTKLRYYNVWHNFPTHEPPKASQLWHRDPEDRAVLKMFLYLTKVNPENGPLSYAPGTHLYGKIRNNAPSVRHKEGSVLVKRSDDNQMNTLVPESRWITATAEEGTIVLADTTGYHKGGWVREGERIVYTCMFASGASVSPEIFRRSIPMPHYENRSVEFAISQ